MAIDGAKVRETRQAAGLSQGALADRAGVSRQTINQVEQGQTPRLLTLRAIAAALDVTPAHLELATAPAEEQV